MSTSISSQTASKNALDLALSEHNIKSGDVNGNDEISESQEIEAPAGLGGLPLNETARTVFEDPNTFNVKHPLYSSWTLWYDSPATKGKPGAPPTPATSVPPTPMSAQGMGWMEDIKRVVSFGSVEEFWGVYNNIVPPSHLPQKANYYLFKEGIMPAWEDDANKNGGKWSIQFPRDKTRERIDKFWLFTMLAAIGETFDATFSAAQNPDVPVEHAPPVSLVTGVIVSTRPQFYRLSIWTRLSPLSGPSNGRPIPNGSTPIPVHPSEEGEPLRERIESIGKHFKMNVLGFQESQKLVGPLATEVEFASHKDTDRKAKNTKKLVV